jgi:hypothetical protein
MRPDELERRLREGLDALGPALPPSCSTSSCCPTSTRADRIGEFLDYPESRAVCLRLEWLSQTLRGQRAGAEGVDKR